MVLNNILNFIFSPFLLIPPWLAVILLSLIVSVAVTLITKYATDQNLMKRLREEIKELQKEAKDLKNNQAKMGEIHKRFSDTNAKFMMQSLKPTLIFIIPSLLILSWMQANFAFEPINPGEDFAISVIFDKNSGGTLSINAPEGIKVSGETKKTVQDGRVSWILNGEKEGDYIVEFDFGDEKYAKDVLITNGKLYAEQIKKIKNSKIKEIKIDYRKLIILPVGINNWFGWLGVYFWTSVLFSSVFRKVFKVY